MRILITGGAGFQGSHLAERLLDAGHKVTLLNTYSQQAERNISGCVEMLAAVWGSVTDAEVVEKTLREQAVVFHMAARVSVDESIETPESFLNVNVMGMYNVLEAAKKHGVRVIFASTCEVYGYAGDGLASETSELRPHSPYAASKAGADRLCFAYWMTHGLNVTVVRPCNIYGPRQRSGRSGAVIPRFVDRALSGEPLTVFGTGQQRREYMHVNDLVDAYHLVLDKNPDQGEAINLGTGETPSIREIAEFVAQKLDARVEYGPGRPGEVEGFNLDTSRSRLLGFEPRVPFWDGLDEYIRLRTADNERNAV